MAKVHTGNMNFRVPQRATSEADHELRMHGDFPRKEWIPKGSLTNHASAVNQFDVKNGRNRGGGGRGRGGSRGFGSREYRAYGNGNLSKANVAEIPIENGKTKTKPVSISAEFRTISESVKPFNEELTWENVEISLLKEKIEEKEKELEVFCQENVRLKSQLNEATSKISSARAKEEEMALNINRLGEELRESKNNVSFAKAKEEEMTWKLKQLRDVSEESRNTVVQLKEKLQEYEGAEGILETEMKLKVETERWRKAAKAAAKAAATVLAGGVEIHSEAPEFEPLVLWYSDRAAKRMSLGRLREALEDCMMAAALDPNFLKVCLTAGNCYLVLGEVEDALYHYNKCLESDLVCLDRRVIIEASDGLQKALKVVNCLNQSASLLQQKTFDSATNALGIITEALSISCYSEKLLEMKGEALFVLRKYEEIAHLCKQTLDFSEKNFATQGVANHMANVDDKSSLMLWRWSLMSRSYFHLGRLDTALDLIEKQEQLKLNKHKNEESSIPLAETVRELLRCKNAGNEAFQSGRHREALEHYGNALLRSIESRPFSAVCFFNRAAAHTALGEVIDAIADCSVAIALDGSYSKALYRRATLYEMIRDYEHAAHDIQRIISILQKQSQEKSQQSCTPGRPTGCGVEDLRVARSRLSSVEKKAKEGTPFNLYLILGLKDSDDASEIKKAYRKAALRHHPDKAGKFLTRSEGGDVGQLWKEMSTLIHMDADRLFKMIGEAYTVLSDPNKRLEYDIEEAKRI